VKLRAPAPIVIATFIVLAVAAVWAISMAPVVSRVEAVVSGAIEGRAAAFLEGLDVAVSYQNASPRLLGSITLGGLELRSGGTTVARAGSAVLRYDLSSALAGTFAISLIRVEDLAIETSYEEAVSLVERLVGKFAGGGASPDSGPAIELRNADLRLSFDGGAWAEARLKAADIVLGPGGTIRASVAGTVRAEDPRKRFAVQQAELPFSLTGSYRLDSREASVSAIVAGDSDVGTLETVRVSASLDASGVEASLEPRDGLERLNVSWNAATERLSLDARVSGWMPRSLLKPHGPLSSMAAWFGTSYSGSVSVSTDLSPAGTTAAVDLSAIVPLDLPGGRPRMALTASGSWQALAVRSATFRNDAIQAEFSGELLPARLGATGVASLRYALAPGLIAEAGFDVSGAGSSWFAYAPAISLADAVLRDGTISVELSKSNASFYIEAALPYAETEARSSSGQADPESVSLEPFEAASASRASRIVIEGAASLGESPYAEAAIRLGVVHLDAFPVLLGKLAGPQGVSALSPLSVEGELSVYSDFSGLSYNSSGLLLVYDGAVSGFGLTSFSGGLGLLNISSIDATIAGYSLTGSASIDYGSGAGAGFEADLLVQGVPYALDGTMIDGAIVLSGDYGLRFVARREAGSFGASLDVADMPVPLLGTVSFLSASANARFTSADSWDVVFDDLSLSQPPGSAKAMPSISASGAFDESGGRFGRLTYADRISSLQGVADVTWMLGDGFRVSANVRMTGADGEYYVVDGECRGPGGVDAVVSMRKSPLARLGIPALRGAIDADATISGTVDEPVARFSFTVNGGQRAEGLPFLAGSGGYGGKTVTLTDTRVRLGEQSFSGLSLSYDVDDAGAELSADVELSLGANTLSGRLVASGSSSSAGQEAASPFDEYRASGALEDGRWTDGGLDAIPFSLSILEGGLSLSVGGKGELRASLGKAGELSLSLDRSMPVSFSAEGRYADASISLDVADARVDMPFLFKLIGLPMLRVESGIGTGSLRIRGKAIDPTIEGVVEFENFYMSVPDFVSVPLGPIEDPLYFTGRTMETSQAGIPCGDAMVMLSLEGTLHGGIPDTIRLALQTSGEGVVPVSTRLLGLDINGLAKPDLSIEAGANRSRIRGSIAMQSGDIVLTTGLVRQKSTSTETVDFVGSLDLSFGKAVKIYFPDKRLPVLYGQVDPSSRLAVGFDAAKGDFSLKGTTMLRGGSVFYIQRNFYLKQATIEFDEDADQFDPKISAEAETRTSTSTGPVVVTLRAVDSHLSDLAFAIESVPRMSEADILQVLGQNLLGGTGGGRVDLGRAIVENSDLIPQLNVASIFERNLQAILGLDLFVVRSQVFQRWLYDLSGLSALSGISDTTTLADYLDNTAIVGGKYIGDKLFFQVMLTLVSDPLASTIPLSLDSDISIEWKAPHFTLNWSVQPKNLDTLFIEDQSFSFLWRIPLQ